MYEDNSLTINGKGLKSLKKPKNNLDAGNSGTLIVCYQVFYLCKISLLQSQAIYLYSLGLCRE